MFPGLARTHFVEGAEDCDGDCRSEQVISVAVVPVTTVRDASVEVASVEQCRTGVESSTEQMQEDCGSTGDM